MSQEVLSENPEDFSLRPTHQQLADVDDYLDILNKQIKEDAKIAVQIAATVTWDNKPGYGKSIDFFSRCKRIACLVIWTSLDEPQIIERVGGPIKGPMRSPIFRLIRRDLLEAKTKFENLESPDHWFEHGKRAMFRELNSQLVMSGGKQGRMLALRS